MPASVRLSGSIKPKRISVISRRSTVQCGNLFVYILERCNSIGNKGTIVGMIVPLSAFSTDRMIPLIRMIKKASTDIKIANFSWRPGKLFEGVNLQLSILKPVKKLYS